MSSHPATYHTLSLVVSLLLMATAGASRAADPLPSWNDGISKRSILAFVERVTQVGGAEFVPAEERVAVFDNDGTLWSEQPVYSQLAFAVDRVKALAAQHPEWASQQPFQAVIEDDHEALASTGMEGLMQLIMVTHAGMSSDEFGAIVKEWLKDARHPRLKRPYTELVYQPMLEVLDYLRTNG